MPNIKIVVSPKGVTMDADGEGVWIPFDETEGTELPLFPAEVRSECRDTECCCQVWRTMFKEFVGIILSRERNR